jgi:hypothetical protein
LQRRAQKGFILKLSDDKGQLPEEWFPLYEAISNAIFVAMLPWLPKDRDTAIHALLGEAVMLATYEDNRTGRDDRNNLRAFLHGTLDEFLGMAFQV